MQMSKINGDKEKSLKHVQEIDFSRFNDQLSPEYEGSIWVDPQIPEFVDWEVGGTIHRRVRFGAKEDMISFGYVEIKVSSDTQVYQVVQYKR